MALFQQDDGCNAVLLRPFCGEIEVKVQNLAYLQDLILNPPSDRRLILAAGVHEVDHTLEISGADVQIEGERSGVRLLTILKRGRTPDGSLFQGPLIRGRNLCGLSLSSFIINGLRFEETERGLKDNRHPLTPERNTPLFPSAVETSIPAAYQRESFYTPFETDLLFTESSGVTVRDVTCNNPIKFGLGFGDEMSEVAIDGVRVFRGGNGGIWCGLTSLSDRPTLPLDAAIASRRPHEIRIRDSVVEDCGASGIYLEAARVEIHGCTLAGNHCDYPFNEEGGQIEIDYKADDVEVRECTISNAPCLRRSLMVFDDERREWQQQVRLLRAVGIEAFGQNLRFIDNIIERNSHEGIHLNGANRVCISGGNTCLRGNHTAQTEFPELVGEPLQNVSVTTLEGQRALGAIAGDLRIEGIRCENGIMFWSDGSIPDLTIDHVIVRNCDLRGHPEGGLHIGRSASGQSIRGTGWKIEKNLGVVM